MAKNAHFNSVMQIYKQGEKIMQNNEIEANEALTQVSAQDNLSEIRDEKPKNTEDGNIITPNLNRDITTNKTEQYHANWIESGGNDIKEG